MRQRMQTQIKKPMRFPITHIAIYDAATDMREPVFILAFYGLAVQDFTWIAYSNVAYEDMLDKSGADKIRRALERRGFDPDRYYPVIWDIRPADQPYARGLDRN